MKKAFIYVGHSNWGKSFAVKQLTGGSSKKKTTIINNKWVWVRKMSNDDEPAGLRDFVDSIPNRGYENFILTYCPKHHTDTSALQILNSLQQSCELYFFVQKNKFSDPTKVIKRDEIAYLKTIGTVEELDGHFQDIERGRKFLEFIEKYL